MTLSATLYSVDINSYVENPQASFTILPASLTQIKITYTALVSKHITLQRHTETVTIAEGRATFSIPQYTEVLKVEFNTVDGLQYTSLTTPEGMAYNLTRTDLALFLVVNFCNSTAIDTTALDHTPVAEGESRTFGHQLGPCRTSRAMAMVHMAMMEAYIVYNGGYNSYLGLDRIHISPSAGNYRLQYQRRVQIATSCAILKAALDTLISLYPSHEPRLTALFATEFATIPNTYDKEIGTTTGTEVATAVIANRIDDGSAHADPIVGEDYTVVPGPGVWNIDPISDNHTALGARWAEVAPFVLTSASQFRCAAPPALNSTEYMMAFDEVKCMGGNGDPTATVRSDYCTFIGNFFGYDGSNICAPIFLYNSIARVVLHTQQYTAIQFLHIYALINVAMADAGIACWESKWHYKFWRPVTGIRLSDDPDLGDGNDNTTGDPEWTPLGVPVATPGATPPFPALPSGHATFGATLCKLLHTIIGTDKVTFTFVSNEYNGITVDNHGHVRPRIERTFFSLYDVQEENGQSRIYLGVHWSFDKTTGITMGHSVADYIYPRLYTSTD